MGTPRTGDKAPFKTNNFNSNFDSTSNGEQEEQTEKNMPFIAVSH